MSDPEAWGRNWDDDLDDYPDYTVKDSDYYTRMANRGIWVAQTGQEHKISGMSDRHLRNSIALIQRGGAPTRQGCLKRLLEEQDHRKGQSR